MGPQFVIFLFLFSSMRAISPKYVNVKSEHAPSSAEKKKQGEAQKSSLRGCRA
jgi:hypothetical protein